MKTETLTPLITKYIFPKTNNFEEVSIFLKKNYGYIITYQLEQPKPLGKSSFIEFKSAIIGGWGSLKSDEELVKEYNTFDTYDECIEIIKKRDGKTFEAFVEKGKVEDYPFLLSIKKVK